MAAVAQVAVVAVAVVGNSDCAVVGLRNCIEVRWAGVTGREAAVGELVGD